MISIVIPVYNSSQYLSRCIECVLNQTFKDWELLLVDDGIFLFPKLKNVPEGYLKEILSIPEVKDLREFSDVFHCASWIKKSVIYRLDFVFKLYFRFTR